MSQSSLVAIIPAAGHSRRMGQPKLLLPWRGATVIAHLVGELQAAGIRQIVVVMRSGDEALRLAVSSTGATPVQPEIDPPDMRTSVEQGLRAVRRAGPLGNDDSLQTDPDWLLIPADYPIVSRTTVEALRAVWEPGRRQILIPTFDGRRGHPTFFSGDFAGEVAQIPADCGLNWLVKQNSDAIREVPVSDPGVICDLDTPEDYQALLTRSNESA